MIFPEDFFEVVGVCKDAVLVEHRIGKSLISPLVGQWLSLHDFEVSSVGEPTPRQGGLCVDMRNPFDTDRGEALTGYNKNYT